MNSLFFTNTRPQLSIVSLPANAPRKENRQQRRRQTDEADPKEKGKNMKAFTVIAVFSTLGFAAAMPVRSSTL